MILISPIEISRKQYEAGFAEGKSVTKEGKNDDVKVSESFAVWSVLRTCQPKRDKFAGLSRRAKRRKLAREDETEQRDKGAIAASIRSAKKMQRPTKIGLPEARDYKKEKKAGKIVNKKTSSRIGRGLGFTKDAGDMTKPSREGARARKGDAIGAPKKGHSKRR
jgi:ATP-dependent RNA helicase DDX27